MVSTTTIEAHIPQVHHVRIILVPSVELNGYAPPGPNEPLSAALLDLATDYVKKNALSAMNDPFTIVGIGEKVAIPQNGRLVDHDSTAHQHIPLWTESDIIQWECDRPFVILSVDKFTRGQYQAPDSPATPFYLPPPYASDGNNIARSSIAKFQANGQHYKARIQVGGRTLDPDMICGFPPP